MTESQNTLCLTVCLTVCLTLFCLLLSATLSSCSKTTDNMTGICFWVAILVIAIIALRGYNKLDGQQDNIREYKRPFIFPDM